MSSCSIIIGNRGYVMSNNKRTTTTKITINKRAVRIQSIKRVVVRTGIIATIKRRVLYEGPVLLFSFNNRKPFKMTRIVLPSCPITPNGRAKNCKKFEQISIAITASEKITFCFTIRFIRFDKRIA